MCPTREEAERVLRQAKYKLKHADDEEEEDPFLSTATAARYLRGYKNENVAAKNMASTYQYRRLVHANDLGTNQDTYKTVWTELAKRNMFLAAKSDGATPPSPVLILRKRGDAFDKGDFEEYRRAFFFTLDCTARIADAELAIQDPIKQQTGQWVLVMDMAGYSSKNSPPLSVSLETMRIFQNHFPERAKRIVIIDAPNAFAILWRMLSPFIESVTREKFMFLSRSQGDEELRRILGETIWGCIEMDMVKGKEISAQLMIDAGLLRSMEVL
ncbi:CRAL-TRIO domain-containing protein T23G5.2 [Gracilariopsis chorda]|uniref:CRAL-TRIO domain-containing protein T23G5.2 n=1 Tax=Gracilariopsis chorda TaxID=448386 RepID=A0A2V3J3C0_9FLOR|nr:CRAL-TRIO domain-containing protein T23G5.2 [Gracilariopsis chorda]|eukprot:PXF48612.1 CRAL-TRIO domain-containing protein T23G5.2 [Gracilariopsis chorda]